MGVVLDRLTLRAPSPVYAVALAIAMTGVTLGCGGSLPMPQSAGEAAATLLQVERTLDDVQMFAGPACSMLHSHPDFAEHCRVYRETYPRARLLLGHSYTAVRDAAAVETLTAATATNVRELLSLVDELSDRYLP